MVYSKRKLRINLVLIFVILFFTSCNKIQKKENILYSKKTEFCFNQILLYDEMKNLEIDIDSITYISEYFTKIHQFWNLYGHDSTIYPIVKINSFKVSLLRLKQQTILESYKNGYICPFVLKESYKISNYDYYTITRNFYLKLNKENNFDKLLTKKNDSLYVYDSVRQQNIICIPTIFISFDNQDYTAKELKFNLIFVVLGYYSALNEILNNKEGFSLCNLSENQYENLESYLPLRLRFMKNY